MYDTVGVVSAVLLLEHQRKSKDDRTNGCSDLLAHNRRLRLLSQKNGADRR